MERFIIGSDVAAALPNMQVVIVVARNLSNKGPSPRVSTYASSAASAVLPALDALPNAQSHPRIAHYRATLKDAAGIAAKKFPQSNESLLKRLVKAREPGSINPLVDFYNAVSTRRAVTAGAFDSDDLAALGKGTSLELRFSRAGDVFTALDAGADSEPVAVPPKELSYCVGDVVLTRQLAWRQSLQGLVTENTTSVILMSEVLDEAGNGTQAAQEVRDDLVGGLKDLFGVDATSVTLGASSGTLETGL